MKKQWFALVLVMALAAISIPAEAQVVVGQTHSAVGAPVYYGIPAAHGPVSNGTVRHYNNGYVGVNARHGSRLPMTWGTGPIRATGPIVGYRPYATYGCAGRGYGGYGYGGYGYGGYGYGGTRGFIRGGVSGYGWSVGGSVGW